MSDDTKPSEARRTATGDPQGEMTKERVQPHRAHLYLIELLIGVLLLGVAGFFLVRGMGIAREREQRRQMTEALQECDGLSWRSDLPTKTTERIWALVKTNPKLHDAKSNFGVMPLHVAARHANREIAQWLLDCGADVNAKADDGGTPLHWGAMEGHKEVAELLLAKGADVNAKDNDGMTPLYLAALLGHKEVAEMLLEKGADVNAKDDDGLMPLFRAAHYGHKEVVELLLAKGADVNAKDDDGNTPLYWAKGNSDQEIIDLLLKHGAKE